MAKLSALSALADLFSVIRRLPGPLAAAALLSSCAVAQQTRAQLAPRLGEMDSSTSLVPRASSHATRVVLLGTFGGPGGNAERAGIASLLVVGEQAYLIDAGISVDRQLVRAGFSERDIRTVFLTHLHDDHTAGLPGLLTFAYTLRNPGVTVLGPANTDNLVNGILAYMMPNAEIRAQEQQTRPPAAFLRSKVVGPGTVFSDGTITVTAAPNSHYHFAGKPSGSRDASYSYRFETPDRVIVFTGDTGPDERIEKLARGADVLVAEMMTTADVVNVPPDIAAHMVRDHLSPSQVGMLAAAAGVKTLVLSHTRNVTEVDLATIRSFFAGEIILGKDLDQI